MPEHTHCDTRSHAKMLPVSYTVHVHSKQAHIVYVHAPYNVLYLIIFVHHKCIIIEYTHVYMCELYYAHVHACTLHTLSLKLMYKCTCMYCVQLVLVLETFYFLHSLLQELVRGQEAVQWDRVNGRALDGCQEGGPEFFMICPLSLPLLHLRRYSDLLLLWEERETTDS